MACATLAIAVLFIFTGLWSQRGEGMLVRFSSTATESITMFGDSAVQLIKMLGATGNVPGALSAEDIPTALNRLRQQLQLQAAAKPKSQDKNEDEDDKEHEPAVELAARALPLIDLLERAGAANAPLMWEAH